MTWYLDQRIEDREPGTENFKKSKISHTNKNLFIKSYDNFKGPWSGDGGQKIL
jgi:hypothetical protein